MPHWRGNRPAALTLEALLPDPTPRSGKMVQNAPVGGGTTPHLYTPVFSGVSRPFGKNEKKLRCLENNPMWE